MGNTSVFGFSWSILDDEGIRLIVTGSGQVFVR
jgi:hypothetical protein